MGELGNFYCVLNNCSRVVWRPYQKKVRYRYPEDEDWTYVNGDDFSIEDVNCCYFSECVLTVYCEIWNYFLNSFRASYTGSFVIQNKIVDPNNPYESVIPPNSTNNTDASGAFDVKLIDIKNNKSNFRFDILDLARSATPSIPRGFGDNIKLSSIVINLKHENEFCTKCLFKIFENNEIIYQETRNVCPEVELIDCQLSDTFEELKIDKLSTLERIEIRNQEIKTIYVSPLEAPLIETSPLPEHCYHIYKTVVSAPPTLSEYVPIPGVINPYQFIAEICSDEECLPPEFEVYCDCDCRNCPDGTCATICDTHVCCNDTTTGQLVESIPTEEYCLEALPS